MSQFLIFLQMLLGILSLVKDEFVKNINRRKWLLVVVLVAMVSIAGIQIYLQQQEDFKNQYTGTLTTFASSTADSPALVMGNGTVLNWGGGSNNPAILWGQGDGLKLSLIGGRINVSMPIRNSDGDEIGQIVNNVWTIYSPQLIQDRNFTANSLEIKDLKGDVTFQIQITGNQVHLAGCFYPESSGGTTFSIGSWLTAPMFLYPSINYPHEFNASATLVNTPGSEIEFSKVGQCLLIPSQ